MERYLKNSLMNAFGKSGGAFVLDSFNDRDEYISYGVTVYGGEIDILDSNQAYMEYRYWFIFNKKTNAIADSGIEYLILDKRTDDVIDRNMCGWFDRDEVIGLSIEESIDKTIAFIKADAEAKIA